MGGNEKGRFANTSTWKLTTLVMSSLETLLADLRSGNAEKAEAASIQIRGHGEAAVEALTELLHTKDSDIRWWAIRALATFDNPKVFPYLIRGLKDNDTAVQQCAALALRERPDPRAIPDLIDLLGYKNQMLSRLAGDALIAIGEGATNALMIVVKKGSPAAKVEATRVLSAIGDPNSISTLFGLLEEESTLIRHWAEEGLNKMGIGMVFFKPD